MIVCAWKDILEYAPLLSGIEEAFVAVQSTIAPDVAEVHRKYLNIQYVGKLRVS